MKKFENALTELELQTIEMANLATKMLRLASSALQIGGEEIWPEVTGLEEQLDSAQVQIDSDVVRLMTVYSPVATDLRKLIVTMHVTSQLERIGDQVINICETLSLMGEACKNAGLPELVNMAELVTQMVEGTLAAYFDRNVEQAQRMWRQDDLVDAKNAQIIKTLLSDEVLSRVLKGTEDVADTLAQTLLARHLERIADQAVNIGKEVVYLVEGHDVRHEASS